MFICLWILKILPGRCPGYLKIRLLKRNVVEVPHERLNEIYMVNFLSTLYKVKVFFL